MPVLTPERVDEVVAGWRDFSNDDDTPAGPMFTGYTESEITMTGSPFPTTKSVTCPAEVLIDYCDGAC